MNLFIKLIIALKGVFAKISLTNFLMKEFFLMIHVFLNYLLLIEKCVMYSQAMQSPL